MKKKLLATASTLLGLLFIASVPTTVLSTRAVPTTYSVYVAAPENGSGLMLEPTLVLEPDSFNEITEAKASEKKAASVILTPDADMNVELGGETKTLKNAFDTYLKGTFIPMVRVDSTTVTHFIDWMNNTYTVSDMMVISKDIEAIEKLYADSTTYLVNTVYDLTDVTIGTDRYEQWTNIGAANKAGCNILLYSVQPNLPVAAEYVEAMAKVCWAVADSKEEAVEAMAAGCYGVVSSELSNMTEALGYFEKDGFARAQYIAAHRGITAYCNEQSKTAIAASANEGATHIELDLQVTADEQILICHNNTTGSFANGNLKFVDTTAERIRQLTLQDYTKKYGDTFPTLEEAFDLLLDTDVIFILELKLDGGSTRAVDELKAIENLKRIIDKYPKMQGRIITIAFYAPYAEKMKEVLPEIPCGFLGGAKAGKETDQGVAAWGGGSANKSNVANFMRTILRKYNVSIDDMTFDNGRPDSDPQQVSAVTNQKSADYLARGYAQNTWTFQDLRHYSIKCNIATTNGAEKCAMVVKNIGVPASLTEAQLTAKKATVPCVTYNGWKVD